MWIRPQLVCAILIGSYQVAKEILLRKLSKEKKLPGQKKDHFISALLQKQAKAAPVSPMPTSL